MRAVALLPAIGLIAGSAVGVAGADISHLFGAVVLLLALLVAACAFARSWPRVVGISVAVGFFVGGAMLSADAWHRAWRPPLRLVFEDLARQQRAQATIEGRRLPLDDEAFATIEGVLRADAPVGAVNDGDVSLTVDVDAIDRTAATGGVQLSVVGTLAAARAGEWRTGRRVRMPVQLRRPSRYLNPGVPDNERALARRGITLVGTVKSGALVELLGRAGAIDECTSGMRAYCRRAIARAVGRWSERSAAVVSAIVIGDRAGLGTDVQRRLQDAGTYHVIAISGGNIAILAGLLLAGFRVGGMLGRGAMIGAGVVLVAYAHLVAGGASVERATLMAVIYFAARALDYRSPPLNTLAFVAACLLAAQPLAVVDPAFILTFGATLAIVLVVPSVQGWQLPGILVPAAGLFAASVATEIGLLPVGAVIFSRVTVAGLVLNFVAIPLMSVAQIAGMAIVPVTLVSTYLAAALGYIAHLAASGLVRSADLVEIAPVLAARVAPPHWSIVVVYYLGLAVAVSRRWRLIGVTVTVLAGVWIVAEPWALFVARGSGRIRVTFVDVGQGDSVIVRFPLGTTLIVDTGGTTGASSFDIGDRVVAPVLRDAGIWRLDLMALTHGDPDHIGGAAAIIREFRPRQVWEGIPVPPFEPLRQLRAEAKRVDAVWSNVKAGDRLSIDDVEVIVRHPDVPDWERQRVRNDDSIVLELRWRDVSVVLTGDIGRAVERNLLATIPHAPLRIVKVPHHGSLTSSTPEFIKALAPTVAVVSAGRSNHFGHPVPEVLQRYRDAGAQVFRTDEDGAVTVETDGTSLSVQSFTGRTYSYEPQRAEPQRAEPQRAQRAQRGQRIGNAESRQ